MNKLGNVSVGAGVGLALGLAMGSAAALWSVTQTTDEIQTGYASAQTWISVGNGQTESDRVYFQGGTYPVESELSASSAIRTGSLPDTLPGLSEFLMGDAPTVSIAFTLCQVNTGKFTQSARLALLYPAAFADLTGSIKPGACPALPVTPTTPLSELGANLFATTSFGTTQSTSSQTQTTQYCLTLGHSPTVDATYENTVTLSGIESQPLEVSDDSTSTWAGDIASKSSTLSSLDGLKLQASLFWGGP